MLDALDVKKSVAHIEWLTNNTPNRLSGGGQDMIAAEYICKAMESYGLETKILDFEAYNSHPGRSEVKVVFPEEASLKSLPCGHNRTYFFKTKKGAGQFVIAPRAWEA